MKSTAPITNQLWRFKRTLPLSAAAVAVGLLCPGCKSAVEAPPPAQQQQSTEAQIQSIRNSPNMPEAAKQQAIAGIQAQQNRNAAKP